MDSFSREELQNLVETSHHPVATIYQPTYRAGREVEQNATRFKNLIKTAREMIEQRYPGAKALKEQLDEAAELQTKDDWWQHQSDGLAIFLDEQGFSPHRVPVHFEELVTVADRYHVLPMVRLLQGDGRFCILAVSQNTLRLFEASQYGISSLNVEQLPSDLRSALNIDEYTSSLQQHSTGAPTAADSMMFHGQGGADMDIQKKDELRQFFHRVDSELTPYLTNHQQNVPLVFAGVDYLFPLFRETCEYRQLIDQPVTGNPDDVQAEELHRQAWKLVEPHYAQRQLLAVERFHDASDGPKTLTDLEEIIQAGRQGAIDTLLIADDQHHWAVVDEAHGRSEAIKENTVSTRGAEDLLNYAAIQALTTGGTVFCLPAERMPGQSKVSALLRFPVPST